MSVRAPSVALDDDASPRDHEGRVALRARILEERFVRVHAQVGSLSDLGRGVETLDWLQVSLETRDRVALLTLVHPAFDGLREDPRVEKVGFPEDPAGLVERG